MKFIANFQIEIDAESVKEAEKIIHAMNGFIYRCATLISKVHGVSLKSLRRKNENETL